MGLGREGTVAPPPVEVVGARLHHVGHGRVVRHLLHVDLSTVIVLTLVGLTENRVERLVEPVAGVQETQTASHHQLHSFDWVSGHGRSCHVSWGVNRHRGDKVQKGLARHAADREGHRTQVELS